MHHLHRTRPTVALAGAVVLLESQTSTLILQSVHSLSAGFNCAGTFGPNFSEEKTTFSIMCHAFQCRLRAFEVVGWAGKDQCRCAELESPQHALLQHINHAI